MKSKNINIKELIAQGRKIAQTAVKHSSFAAIMIVLLAYLLVVWKISSLATAEPSDSDVNLAASSIPKVDKKAVLQIQALEQNNTQVHSLFNQARNNPFQE
ncbi:hypothetical protein KW789_00160 [Candidatus Saccharibacteria bacterium]|jgi:hypothetical protein|nr:hypothetical protein [Candidatus Saccharibacteria bacterium]